MEQKTTDNRPTGKRVIYMKLVWETLQSMQYITRFQIFEDGPQTNRSQTNREEGNLYKASSGNPTVQIVWFT